MSQPPARTTRRFRALALSTAVGVAALTACSSGDPSATAAVAGVTTGEASADSAETHNDASDQAWNAVDEIAISLKGGSATASKAAVDVHGSTVTISAAGTYRLSGALDDGRIVVASPGDGIVRLVLDGVDIHSSTSAPIAVMEADEVMVVLADGSKNILTDATTYDFPDAATDEPNATLFSAADLTISGNGSLTVDGSFNDGIASKDGLVISSGTVVVEAVDDGIRGKDYVVIDGGSLTVTAGGDGLKSDNDEDATKGYVAVNAGTVKLTTGGDGISATTDVIVADGAIDVTAGGGSTRTVAADASAKGLKGAVSVVVKGGSVTINSADDAINSNDRVVVNGGEIRIATGNDGVHADASLEMNGGSIDVTKSYEGIESKSLTVAGGEVRIVSSDDGVNAAGGNDGSGAVAPGGARPDAFAAGAPTLTISGGRIVVDSGGDGLDVNGSATMTNGTVIVNGPTAHGDSAVDYDGTFKVSGGLLVAAGSSGMVMAPSSSSSQGSLLKTFTAQAAGTLVHIKAIDGDSVLTFAPTKSFQSIVLSSATVSAGVTYEVTLGGSASGSSANGLYEADAHTGGTVSGTTTTTAASSQTMTAPGGRP